MKFDAWLDLSQWIEAASLDEIQAHLRESHAAEDAVREEWRATEDFEQLAKLDRISELLHRGDGPIDDRDVPELDDVVSPVTLAYLEQYRTQQGFAARGWPSKPVDVFIWGFGEPPVRCFTKIGGLPYRPANLPWPKIAPDDGPYPAKSGEPMTFLGQINFAGSRDLFPNVIDDVLLIFVEDESFGRREAVHFEWQTLGIADDELIVADNVPHSDWQILKCYGYRYRTVDYRAEFPAEFSRYHPQRRAAVIDATKIGGIPNMQQMSNSEFDEMIGNSKRRFLAQIKSLFPHREQYYPWINHKEPLELESYNDHIFNLVDDGSIYLLIDDDGNLDWHFECG